MIRPGVPIIPPAYTTEGLQVTTVKVGSRRDAHTFLAAHITTGGGEYEEVKEQPGLHFVSNPSTLGSQN